MNSEKLKIRAFLLHEFKLGNMATSVTKCICSTRRDVVSERTAKKMI